MDGRNEDSGGSDYSLNGSLQRKCIVDEMKGVNVENGVGVGGVGGGVSVGTLLQKKSVNDILEFVKQESSTSITRSNMAKEESTMTSTGTTATNAAGSSVVGKKTEQVLKDADGGGGLGGGGGGGGHIAAGNGATGCSSSSSSSSSSSCTNLVDGQINFEGFKQLTPRSTTANLSNLQTTEVINSIIQDSILNKIDVSNPLSEATALNPSSAYSGGSSCSSNNHDGQILYNTASSSNSNSNNNSNAFETKVKQISKNLKETSLQETQSLSNPNGSLNIRNDYSEDIPSTSPSISSSSLSIDYDTSLGGNITDDTQCTQTTEMNASMQSISESTDDTDQRSKKVRFHPDVKENDGGNRIIPKKKKKLKNNASCSMDEAMPSTSAAAAAAAAANALRTNSVDDDMDMDEEEEAEEEEDFDLEKTIAEANDFLKVHPLTFARSQNKKVDRIRNGLLEEEDLPELIETSDDEDLYGHVQPENGIERILGKQTKGNKVEFLLRYVFQPGLYWEQEEIIKKNCPNLLQKYEMFRERREERLMRYVATRQNIRQRYTDF